MKEIIFDFGECRLYLSPKLLTAFCKLYPFCRDMDDVQILIETLHCYV